MASLSDPDSRRKYSGWWGSHIGPKNSKWFLENLTDMDAKVKQMIKFLLVPNLGILNTWQSPHDENRCCNSQTVCHLTSPSRAPRTWFQLAILLVTMRASSGAGRMIKLSCRFVPEEALTSAYPQVEQFIGVIRNDYFPVAPPLTRVHENLTCMATLVHVANSFPVFQLAAKSSRHSNHHSTFKIWDLQLQPQHDATRHKNVNLRSHRRLLPSWQHHRARVLGIL